MTEQDQRIAIAELCGEKYRYRLVEGYKVPGFWELLRHPKLENDWVLREPPDYLHDLNAMHEAENAIVFGEDYGEGLKYSQALQRITEADKTTSRWQWNATAAQRAEALLRATGRWVEE